MNKKKQVFAVFLSAVVLAVLIADTQTAVTGAADGIELCIKVIIPSLFPFLFVTTYLNSVLPALQIPGIRTLGRLLHIPTGSESLLVLGLIGGYPVGAKMIGDAFLQNRIDQRTGRILLGYCNNAGPAFIFGVAGTLFSFVLAPISLWLIHVLSAIITGFLLPRPNMHFMHNKEHTAISASEALQKAISVCTSISGWVIIFRIIMAYLTVYLDPFCSNICMVMITGGLELSNGCLKLMELDSEPLKFALCSVFFAMGGLCVALQSKSVTGSLKWGLYMHGKIIQTCISLILSLLCLQFLYPSNRIPLNTCAMIACISVLIILVLRQIAEKSCGNPEAHHV